MSEAAGGKTLVVVVDDNETGRYAKARTLRRAGYEVLEIGTGEEALRAVRARAPRAVLLDVNLPDVDGWEICKRLKADPATNAVVVLQVSATYVTEADTVKALEGGADGCLVEPLEPSVLIATLRALLRAREAEEALREALTREREARAAAEAASRTKDEFLATLSHELRSPLGAILTWVTLLRGGRLEAAQAARGVQAIERNTRLQMKLVDDLLDVSRITSGKMLLEVGPVDLRAVVEGACESIRPAAELKRIHIETNVDPSLGPISADAARLQQVVWNLLSNAVRFTAKGGSVDLRARSVDSQIEIRVADTGRGIEPSFLPHIFERFRQADASTTRTEGGLGLGLAIVRHLVELHGGTVRAESEGAEMGATFIVRLPLPAVRVPMVRPEPPSARPRTAPQPIPDSSLAGLRILVVDDGDDAREAISLILEQAGALVAKADSVERAMQLVGERAPDVIVSDIAMPHADGFDLIRRVRGLDAASGGAVPAVALTAYARVEERRDILAAGYQACLTKPADAGELVARIASLAGR